MNSRLNQFSNNHSLNFGVSPEVLISLTVIPLLLVLFSSKVFDQILQEISQQSEEILRGDRLPSLIFPDISKLEK